jgi:hypothetical protein
MLKWVVCCIHANLAQGVWSIDSAAIIVRTPTEEEREEESTVESDTFFLQALKSSRGKIERGHIFITMLRAVFGCIFRLIF